MKEKIMYSRFYSEYNNRQNLYKGAQPIVYRKTKFKSRLEATWAMFFDQYKIDWQYESQAGENYIVDFYLPEVFLHGHQVRGVFMETKSAGAWGNAVERQEIIRKAVSIIRKHGNHPFIIVLHQPGYHGEDSPIYEISIDKEENAQVTTLPHYTLFKTGSIHKFTRLLHIPDNLLENARLDHSKALTDFRAEYQLVKAAEVRNHIKDAYEEEWTPKRKKDIEYSEEIEQFVTEYWKEHISHFWTLEEFANAMQIQTWKPSYLKCGSNYSKNEFGEEYILWNDNVMVYTEKGYTFSNRLMQVQKALDKFTELKNTLPPKTHIRKPSTVESLRRTNEAIEYEEYRLNFEPEYSYTR